MTITIDNTTVIRSNAKLTYIVFKSLPLVSRITNKNIQPSNVAINFFKFTAFCGYTRTIVLRKSVRIWRYSFIGGHKWEGS